MEKLGYLGPVGTFSQEAAYIFAKGKPYEPVEYPSIPELIYAANDEKVDLAVVPIENSLEGTVNVTADMLIHEVRLKICGELILPIQHSLLAPEGVTLDRIEMVLSHPQALAQCRRTIHSYLPNCKFKETASTAAAAREVKESGKPWAAIATSRAAEIFGLKVVLKGVQDHQGNSTRFVVLSKTDREPTGFDKTSIAFSVDHRPGSLYQALKIFAENGINLTKIESRPMKTLLGQYLFLVDFEGHRLDELHRAVLDRLSKETKFFMILGSYPRYEEKNQ